MLAMSFSAPDPKPTFGRAKENMGFIVRLIDSTWMALTAAWLIALVEI
jgi:hypothetical protein